MANVTNPLIRQKRDRLKIIIKGLADEKKKIQDHLTSFALTENQKKKTYNLDERTRMCRENLIRDLKTLEPKLKAAKEEDKKLHLEQEVQQNIAFLGVFKEIFSPQQWMAIKLEVERRADGDEPNPLGLNYKDLEFYKESHYKYRKLSQEQIGKMMEFRIMLTGLIEKGCNEFGNAEFLKFISPLNRMILPLKELEKIKKDFLL